MARPVFPHRHLLGIDALSPSDIEALLDMADEAVEVSRQIEKKKTTLRGRTQINLFFEPSTRTDRKSTRLNSSHANISYAVFCLKKKHRVRPQQRDFAHNE